MLKIVVFDGGWGGELVADYLEHELGVVEVVRVIDWQNAPYDQLDLAEICSLAERHLRRYIGRADLIVLGGFAVSECLQQLRQRYPKQRFVGMEVDFHQITRSRVLLEDLMVLVDDGICREHLCQELQRKLPYVSLILPDCSGWAHMIDQNKFSYCQLRAELAWDFRLSDPELKVRRKQNCTQDRPLSEMFDISKLIVRDAMRSERKRSIAQAVMNFERLAQARAEQEERVARAQMPVALEGELRPDAILLLNTHFWEIKPDLERLFGWNVRILDFRRYLLRRVCLALGLRGVDGRRSKGGS